MGLSYKNSTPPPKTATSSGLFRGGLLVDTEFQLLRVRNGCMAEESICPNREPQTCEIYQDHIKLGMDVSILPCQGALIPDEAGYQQDITKALQASALGDEELAEYMDMIRCGLAGQRI